MNITQISEYIKRNPYQVNKAVLESMIQKVIDEEVENRMKSKAKKVTAPVVSVPAPKQEDKAESTFSIE